MAKKSLTRFASPHIFCNRPSENRSEQKRSVTNQALSLSKSILASAKAGSRFEVWCSWGGFATLICNLQYYVEIIYDRLFYIIYYVILNYTLIYYTILYNII
jgi:hypothetical protein